MVDAEANRPMPSLGRPRARSGALTAGRSPRRSTRRSSTSPHRRTKKIPTFASMSVHYILQLETATQVCAAAIAADGQTIARRDIDEPNVHASRLTVLVQALLQESGLTFADLHAVAVSKGPGSYTGLRIGVSVAKGFCYSTDLPLIAVSTLDAMAQGFAAAHPGAIAAEAWLCPMIDARRMEVYTSAYNRRLEQVRPVEARIIDHASFDDLDGTPVTLFGSGADKFSG